MSGLFHILKMDTHDRNVEKHQWQKKEGDPIKGGILKRRGSISLLFYSPVLHFLCVLLCSVSRQSVCAVVLQLGDDGDKILETKDVVAVLALVDHAVLTVMSAGGVSKVNHPHVHHRAALV